MRTLVCLILLLALLMVSASAVPVAYIAQGDQGYMQMNHSAGTCWYFPENEKIEQTHRYDIPSVVSGNGTYCQLSKKDTANMPAGTYNFLYVYPAEVNGRYLKDTAWDNGVLTSKFAKRIDESGNRSPVVMQHLKDMVESGGIDGIEEYIIRVEEPYLTVENQGQVDFFTIRISGKSNLADGTNVTIKIDEWDHAALHDTQDFTFHTVVSKPSPNAPGSWTKDMKMNMQGMTPGWHNTVVEAGGLQTTARFPIYQTWEPNPTPTQYIKYFGNGSIKPDVVTVEVVRTVVQIQEKWHTATPTPAITDALGEPINYPYDAGESISPYAGVVFIMLAAAIVLLAGYRRK